ncbi:hypothetical protein [Yersinia phage fHe-Yen9-04]|uniref:Uncharacterized protein n=2 Tax=Eneladusvirus Yen904 TaxID=2560849 RepID=A0A2C9CWY1_9CAUD|nr:hypothetical protein FDJ41_gp016 [Yersinia phage fHe-Yen9-04]SOK58293.1 hypothetical protein [Yersinia phage fHe-Yen9-04]SOK58826.1 hypothetical protein [Yersinia phage fHe-Yen9-03]VUE36062.1 hypothetical protein [Yersinia phage fHe-Yen9-04]
MKKLLLLAALFSTTVSAQTFTCDNFTLYQGIGNNQYRQVDDAGVQSSLIITIESTEPLITVSVQGDKEVVQFWKDYNVYRNVTGEISQDGNNFIMKTAIQDSTGFYIPVKIEYHCK